MKPMTDTVPKALVPVLGLPFAHWQLSLLAANGVQRVTYSVGHRADMVRAYVGDGSRWSLAVDYVDEGTDLRGTGGAVRLALDCGALDESFFLLYGDSYLPVDMRWVESCWQRLSAPAMMTVLRNEDRWDRSNVILRDGIVTLYDKSRPTDRIAEMEWIDYGLSVLTRRLVDERVQPGAVADVAELLHHASLRGELAGLEVSERFYEVGSREGMEDLERHLAAEQGVPGPGAPG